MTRACGEDVDLGARTSSSTTLGAAGRLVVGELKGRARWLDPGAVAGAMVIAPWLYSNTL
jgi:hypothetical protein